MTNSLYFIKQTELFRILLFFFIFFLSSLTFIGNVSSKDIYLWENVKISPEIILRESYTDNIYLSDNEPNDDYITSIYPGVDMQVAFTPRTRIELLYLGRFDHYQNSENFKTDHHHGNAKLQMESAKGSSLELGAWGEDSAQQPDFETDRSKDYYINALYADANLMLFGSTELFGTYQHSIRRYDDNIDYTDDYDNDFFAVGVVNSFSPALPLLFEYRNEEQENNNYLPEPTKFSYQSVFTGFRWREQQRLSGNLRVGYLWSDYNGSSAYDGWAADTSLKYEIGPFTAAKFSFYRGVRESTRAARDILDYYVFAGGELFLNYTRFDPFRFDLLGRYMNKDYRSAMLAETDRTDDLFTAGAKMQYRYKDWLAFSLGYRYRMNDSNINTNDYDENRIFVEITLLSTGELWSQRFPRSAEQVRYF